tara:strand:+ start:49 stop:438 length:390 start_codon:yes stop_codon:yes gene_type:complete
MATASLRQTAAIHASVQVVGLVVPRSHVPPKLVRTTEKLTKKATRIQRQTDATPAPASQVNPHVPKSPVQVVVLPQSNVQNPNSVRTPQETADQTKHKENAQRQGISVLPFTSLFVDVMARLTPTHVQQ